MIKCRGVEEIINNSTSFPVIIDSRKVPLIHKLICRLLGYSYLGKFKPKGFRDYTSFYLLYCKVHNVYYVDYVHGYLGYFLKCPLCVADATG